MGGGRPGVRPGRRSGRPIPLCVCTLGPLLLSGRAERPVTEVPVVIRTFPRPAVRGRRRLPIALIVASGAVSVLLGVLTYPAWAAEESIEAVVDNLTDWIVGLVAGLATLFLTIGGLRYLMAGGDPGEVEAAKRALKAASIGYGVVILAPVIVGVLKNIVGES